MYKFVIFSVQIAKIFDARRTDVKRGQRVTPNAKRECLIFYLNRRDVGALKARALRIRKKREKPKNNDSLNNCNIILMVVSGARIVCILNIAEICSKIHKKHFPIHEITSSSRNTRRKLVRFGTTELMIGKAKRYRELDASQPKTRVFGNFHIILPLILACSRFSYNFLLPIYVLCIRVSYSIYAKNKAVLNNLIFHRLNELIFTVFINILQ